MSHGSSKAPTGERLPDAGSVLAASACFAFTRNGVLPVHATQRELIDEAARKGHGLALFSKLISAPDGCRRA